MKIIKINLYTPEGAHNAVNTYVYDKDVVIKLQDGFKIVTVKDIVFDDIYTDDTCSAVEYNIEDGKIPAFTPFIIYAPANTEYVEAEVQNTNTFKPIETCLWGSVSGRGLDVSNNNLMRFCLFSYDFDTKTYGFEFLPSHYVETIPDHYALLPSLVYIDPNKQTKSVISSYKNLDDLSKYYQMVSGLVIDLKKLFDSVKGKSESERRAVYERLVYNIIRINSRDDFDTYLNQEGKNTHGGPSFIVKLLYVVFICMAK